MVRSTSLDIEDLADLVTRKNTLECPNTVEDAISRVCEFGRAYELECSPQCSGVKDGWGFQSGCIFGPRSSVPNDQLNVFSNEQWVNRWVTDLYKVMALEPVEPETYFRFVSKKDEYEDAQRNNFWCSKNYRNCEFRDNENAVPENGKSVAIGPLLIYMADRPYVFLMRGDVLSDVCSDGAPLLAINENLQLASELMLREEALRKFYEKNKEKFQAFASTSGVREVDLFNLALGIWDNYEIKA